MAFWGLSLGAAAATVYFLKQYNNGGICTSQRKLDGKVALITGANAGIGKETAKDLVKRGARVYLACRSEERAMIAADEIIASTGNSQDNVQIIKLDLASLESVRSCAREFLQREKKLDILINNAGIIASSDDKSKTVDGIDLTFGVNHLGPFLLTHLLMDAIFSAESSRIVTVSSRAHIRGPPTKWEVIKPKNNPNVYSGFYAYAQSKLANILFTKELASRLEGTDVRTYTLHPGIVRTEIFKTMRGSLGNPLVYRTILALAWPFWKDPWAGAQTVIFCAVDESINQENGSYYVDCKKGKTSEAAKNQADAKTLWDLSLDLVNISPSEIHPKLKL